ncbi:MAG: hypothetical protein K8S13_13980 [Desulfobacula sp.]|uniref:hypothetical protein n=1 Tax=Desulfobacula sp. TaxID=2593537 RepID=UPI0025C0B8CE|nr:hypothetical protein [Desulfobacula sp.]MCD4720947.1 hypothetical protein [Desulfobacula sp.]
MKNIFLIILSLSLVALSSISFAEDNSWEKQFIQTLQAGRAINTNTGGGLAYTPTDDTVLERAIQKAMEMDAPPCEAVKIAVDLKYNPYSVIKNVFGYGGEVDLNQLCMCATESGINKQIIAKAAADAASPLGTPIYSRDEIAQAQCLTGLGYTPFANAPSRIKPLPKPKPLSATSPST